ncbi:mitochondrial import protein Pam17 [Dichomitus squalens]|uniref:Presequence translocated-associated motor subunit PAM17 n=1 Tax=Dichomitus squalens TaxID=114155 RepID=A0A4Q9P082_9APHY|nr:mitochondrial import protein Pam17 [Dichomitus squalens LYAD-421 SS1]EJF66322.1 mitochondrial import protein Pam17 [Dichomitus squalens LYAD-421 SS1]TBU35412.1 mitochondrial import protein Pam17 [Dichomitus squalens]TBU46865.1 mitochondrial import protein Pam17 [Dichomitus squalens]TBU65252.1 mitochondrial import protein Pam17 [Dichomitus squalens]
MSTCNIRPLSRTLPTSTRPKLVSSIRTRFHTPASCRGKATKAPSSKGAATGTSQVSQVEKETLPWQEYLAIRKRKRRWETAVTIPTTVAGFVGGISYFGNLEMDPNKPIFNVDPMFVYGAATLGCAGLGYLIGPVIGSSIWRLTHRRLMRLIEKRDKEFHQHIVKNRVDPTRQSATNPVPDYYGEKIGSLHDYRQWLRDQAKFRRKAASFLAED